MLTLHLHLSKKYCLVSSHLNSTSPNHFLFIHFYTIVIVIMMMTMMMVSQSNELKILHMKIHTQANRKNKRTGNNGKSLLLKCVNSICTGIRVCVPFRVTNRLLFCVQFVHHHHHPIHLFNITTRLAPHPPPPQAKLRVMYLHSS